MNPIPRFLQKRSNPNGLIREPHAPKSVLFLTCESDQCSQEREFQIVSTDVSKRVSVFRCVICGQRVEIDLDPDNSARAEN